MTIYVASKSALAPMWRELRSQGLPIISSWIDEAGPGETSDWPDLWERCIREAAGCECLWLHRKEGEILKGAWVEVGAALAMGTPVLAVGIDEFSVRHHPNIHLFPSLRQLRFAWAYGAGRRT